MDPNAIIEREKARRERLPAWAQKEITRLEANVKYYQEQVAALLVPVGEATVTRGYSPEIPVGSEHDMFRFYLPPEANSYRHWFDVSLKDGLLRVFGDRGLVVYPNASNVVHIALDRN
ncbi:MAG: hypothetical protein M0R66_02460 [Candidatus Omnitrophica bacterium]|jgi:hypothetical protein|nr:hypothetical protein [Sphaerochaeta sp.]MCK9603230.1 hypothetical protein [Candidatus Omnitrophota bacterium]